MKDEVVSRGVDATRVLVNPNGVDPDRYSPAVDGAAVRAKYGLQNAIVVGFIGTFGPWHGAEMLARAFVALARGDPSLAQAVRLLMIGDGATMPEVRRILSEGGALESTVFTGLVPQEDGASYLAACDVLVSPHVPNPDGTPFFGSPTKLFEYMAMGKGIVASNLDQIGEVLEDGRPRCSCRQATSTRWPAASRASPPIARSATARRRGEARLGAHVARAHAPHDRAAGSRRTQRRGRMKRLLAVSWEMPPMYGPRATQVARTLGALVPLGWQPTVVCLDPRRGGPNWRDGGDVALPAGVEAVRVKSPEEWAIVRAAWRLLPALRDRPDPKWVWIAPGAAAATAAAAQARFDGLVTFAQPWSDHLVGLRVHRATKLPWVAHFSDPWVDSPYWRGSAAQRSRWRRMEEDVIREATAVVFVTDETADLVMRSISPDELAPRKWPSSRMDSNPDSAGEAWRSEPRRHRAADAHRLHRPLLRRTSHAERAASGAREAECRADRSRARSSSRASARSSPGSRARHGARHRPTRSHFHDQVSSPRRSHRGRRRRAARHRRADGRSEPVSAEQARGLPAASQADLRHHAGRGRVGRAPEAAWLSCRAAR